MNDRKGVVESSDPEGAILLVYSLQFMESLQKWAKGDIIGAPCAWAADR